MSKNIDGKVAVVTGASSMPGEVAARLKSGKSEDIGNRQWTEKERRPPRRAAGRQGAGDDSRINFEDIPRLTGEQLASMVRLRDVRPKVAVSVRLDARVFDWLSPKARAI